MKSWARSIFLAAGVMVFAVTAGCSKTEEKKPPPTMEDIIAQVVVEAEPPVGPSLEDEERLLKVGVIGPETGEQAAYGLMTLDGVMLAAEVFNDAGGIDGREIEVVHVDSKGSDSGIYRGLEKLNKEQVIAIVAAPTGWATFGPVYSANDTKTIFISAGTRRHIGRSGDYVFRNSLPGERGAEDLIDYCVNELGYKNFALITAMEDESLSISSFFRYALQKAGGEVKAEGHIFVHDDIIAAIKAIKASSALDAIIMVSGPTTALRFVKEARKSGVTLPIVGAEELYTEEYLKGHGSVIDGTLLYASFSHLDKDPGTAEFVRRYKKRRGVPPTTFVADAYDCFMLICDALRRAGAPRPGMVRESLMSTKGHEGVAGPIDMDALGETVRHAYIIRVNGDAKGAAFSVVKTPRQYKPRAEADVGAGPEQ